MNDDQWTVLAAAALAVAAVCLVLGGYWQCAAAAAIGLGCLLAGRRAAA